MLVPQKSNIFKKILYFSISKYLHNNFCSRSTSNLVYNRDVKGTGFCGTGGTGTAKLFFCGMGRDGTEIFGTAGQRKNGTKWDKSGQNGIPWFLFYLIKNYYPPELETIKSKSNFEHLQTIAKRNDLVVGTVFKVLILNGNKKY